MAHLFAKAVGAFKNPHARRGGFMAGNAYSHAKSLSQSASR
jgi:hypothetical protein